MPSSTLERARITENPKPPEPEQAPPTEAPPAGDERTMDRAQIAWQGAPVAEPRPVVYHCDCPRCFCSPSRSQFCTRGR